jgi:hypothetical protein
MDESEKLSREIAEKIISSADLDGATREQVECIRAFLEENPEKEWAAKTIILTDEKDDDGKRKAVMVALAQMPETHEQRATLMAFIGNKISQENMRPIAIITLFEAWISVGTRDKIGGMNPSQDPNRKEVISICGQSIDGRTSMESVEIKRDWQGNIVLGESLSSVSSSDPSNKSVNNLSNAFFQGFVMGEFSKMMCGNRNKKQDIKPDIKPDWDALMKSIPDGVPKDF